MINKITNPVFKLFLKYNFFNKKDINLFHHCTRDNKNLKSYINITDGSIFLEKFNRKFSEEFYPKIFKKYRVKIKFKGKDLSLKRVKNDHIRRFYSFKKYLYKKDVLDFGCGDGEFLNILKKKKITKSFQGVEIRPSSLKRLKKLKITAHQSIFEYQKKFDVIFMYHVLEHLPNPIEILKLLKTKLRRNGLLIIEVPSSSDMLLQNKLLKNFRTFILWSEHLVIYSEILLKKAIKKSGFRRIKLSYLQRYGLKNHMSWFVLDNPGNEDKFKKLNKIDNLYKSLLEKNKTTDTLIAIVKI